MDATTGIIKGQKTYLKRNNLRSNKTNLIHDTRNELIYFSRHLSFTDSTILLNELMSDCER